MIICTGGSRTARYWKEEEHTWDSLCDLISHTTYTNESMAEYLKMSKDKQADIKDVGGFVGGMLKDGLRKKNSVVNRCLLTLDIDYGTEDTLDYIADTLPYAYCIYSTHKHSKVTPRYRLVIPLNRLITDSDEYQALGRKVAEYLGIEQFDSTTYEASRLMYWASTAKDGEWVFVKSPSDTPLDVDKWLSMYKDWHDTTEWAMSSRETSVRTRSLKKAQDPTTKDGLIGAFCRMYPISACIEKFLSDIYLPCGEGRYTFAGGTTSGGAVVYEDKFLYSYHDTDPAHEKELNSFDLVRIHLFGDEDEDVEPGTHVTALPSYTAVSEYLLRDPEIKKATILEGTGFREELDEEDKKDDDWVVKLSVAKDGSVKPTLENLKRILVKDESINMIRFNELQQLCEAPKNALPWTRATKFWTDADDCGLLDYINDTYKVFFPERMYRTAFIKVTRDRLFNPVKDYLENLPRWDGIERVDTLLVEYLGADDNAYTRAATRKLLVAAVKRIYEPGCKFDNILVIQGLQGIGKSTLCARLGGAWFNDSVTLSDTRDMKMAAEKLQGSWIIEFSELQGLRGTTVETIKGFLSRQDDKYRASYGHNVESHPRRCIFFGTTNDTGYLTDPTANRRFWPINTNEKGRRAKNAWDMSEEERAQIWAEVLVRYKNGESLILTPAEEEIANRARDAVNEIDSKADLVEEFLTRELPAESDWDKFTDFQKREYFTQYKNSDSSLRNAYPPIRKRQYVTCQEIWVECYGKNPADIRRQDEGAMTLMFRSIEGWSKRRLRINGKRKWVFARDDFEGDEE